MAKTHQPSQSRNTERTTVQPSKKQNDNLPVWKDMDKQGIEDDLTISADLQASQLNNPDFQTLQRQKFAEHVGHVQGNQHLQTVMRSISRQKPGNGLLQRHPEGAGLSINEDEAVDNIEDPGILRPGSPGAAAGGGETSAGPVTAPPTPTTGEETSPAVGPEGASTTPATGTTTTGAMSLTTAQKVLAQSFGGIHEIVPGNIVLLADRAATWRRYDEVNRGRNNPYANRAWRDGDAQQYIPGLEGFADAGTVYVNQQTPLVTATAHEILHNNTAGDFRGTVGETINEGTTEFLAKKAITAAGIPLGTAVAYPNQVNFVTKLMGLVGEGTLTSAYFGGAGILVEAYEAFHGRDSFIILRGFAEALNITAADPLLRTPSTEQKIAALNSILDEWWVSGDDMSAMIGIIKSASATELEAIRTAIRPRITELTSIGQRTQLRVALGTV